MEKRIIIDGDKLILREAVRDKLVNAAQGLIDQNVDLIMRDLAKTAADSEMGFGELPVTVSFKMTSENRKVTIDASIEWKRTKKCGDSLDLIVIDPDQKELPLD